MKSLERIKLPPGWSKLRWPALILAIGVLLLLLPGKSEKEEVSVPQGAGEQETDFPDGVHCVSGAAAPGD